MAEKLTQTLDNESRPRSARGRGVQCSVSRGPTLTSKTQDEGTYGRLVWCLKLQVLFTILVACAAFLLLTAWRSDWIGPPWELPANEFGALGQWFSGFATSVTVFLSVLFIINDRRRMQVRDILADVAEIQYVLTEERDPYWVVHNGSKRSIKLLEADGGPIDVSVLPDCTYRLRSASPLTSVGYLGDAPKDRLVFRHGPYTWTRTDLSIVGQAVTREIAK